MTVYQVLCLVGVPGILSALLGYFILQFKRVKALSLGLQALLRDRLLQAHRYYTAQGYMTYDERSNITNLYNQYHTLGANGVMQKYYNEMMDLPFS